MTQNDDIRKELESLNSTLGKLPTRNSEEGVPQGYFEDLEQNLSAQLFEVEAENNSRVRRLWTLTGLLAAACIALFFLTHVPSAPDVVYPQGPVLSDAELFYMDEFETEELEGLLTSYEVEDFDAESILLEEDLEDLLNM